MVKQLQRSVVSIGVICLLFAVPPFVMATPEYQVTWLAGSGFRGSSDGVGTNASFYLQEDCAVDGSGTIYVADGGNSMIRKISPTGEVTTLAGTPGMIGTNDGTGRDARFMYPDGIAVQSNGTVYVADEDASTIRKILPNGEVSTIAGSPIQTGTNDGFGTNARFNAPNAVAVDSSGNVYVADTGNCTIRTIKPSGLVSTLAGQAGITGYQDGVGTNALFGRPNAVALDSSTNLYVTDTGSYTLRKITPSGVVTTVFASTGSGKSVVFNFSHIAADRWGNLYYDSNRSDLCEMTTDGKVKTIFSVPLIDDNNNYNYINGLACDNAGNVYLSLHDNTTWKVAVISTKTQFINFGIISPKSYGCPPFEIKVTATSGLPLTFTSSNTNVIVMLSNTATIMGAGTTTITATQSGDSIFKPATASKILFVDKASQTIAFGALKPKTFGSPPIVNLPLRSTSGLPVTYTSDKTNVAVISSNMTVITGVGLSTITAAAPASANYNAAKVSHVLVVSKAPQIISWTTPSIGVLPKGANFALSATTSSGLPVSFKSSNPKVLTIAGSIGTIQGSGKALITAMQSGDANWKAATPVTIPVTVK